MKIKPLPLSFAKTVILAVITLFSFVLVQAQESHYTIKGNMEDEQNQELSYASINLKTTSGVWIKGTFSDEEGLFEIKAIPAGNYQLELTLVGYEPHMLDVELKENLVLAPIVLIADANVLAEVAVTSRQKTLERRADRFVLDVGSSTFQNSNIMDIFRAVPFMQVQEDKVSVNGKSNVLVLVDNVPVPNATLKDVLNSMNGNEIDKIDFITTPGVKYDASVSSVINIRTKRALANGLTGSINGTYSRGEYGRGGIGTNLTYRKRKWVLNGKYSFTRSNNYNSLTGYRQILQGQNTLTLTDDNAELYDNRTHNGLLSLEYNINKQHNVALTGNWVQVDRPNSRYTGRNSFSTLPGLPTDSILTREQLSIGDNTTQSYSFNYNGHLDSLGKKVEAILTYTPLEVYSKEEMLFQEMSLPNGTLLHSLPLAMNENPRTAKILVGQVDVELPFQQDWTLETGFKYNYAKSNSDTYQYFKEGQEWVVVPEYTFINRFHEYITAGYGSVQKKVGSTLLRAGLRIENSKSGVEGVYDHDNTHFFPSLLVQQKLVGKYNLSLNYRKSINRPSFRELSPFRIYLDEYSLVEGNLSLRPTISHTVTLNSNLPASFFMEVAYAKNNDQFMQLPRQEGQVTIYAPTNMDGEEWSANLMHQHKVTNWWNGNAYLRGYHFANKGDITGEQIENKGYAWMLGISESFKLPLGLGMDASYNYYSPFAQGGFKIKSFNYARLAVKKEFMDKKAQLTLAFNDIFKGQVYRTSMETSNLISRLNVYNDTRRVSIGFTYRFGKSTVKNADSKELGNEDVVNRAK